MVLAEDRYLAEDAAELVFADIEQLPAVVDAGPTAERGEQLYGEGNLITTLHAEFGHVDTAFSRSGYGCRGGTGHRAAQWRSRWRPEDWRWSSTPAPTG